MHMMQKGLFIFKFGSDQTEKKKQLLMYEYTDWEKKSINLHDKARVVLYAAESIITIWTLYPNRRGFSFGAIEYKSRSYTF